MAVQFPDIEKTVVAFLNAELDGTAYDGIRVATKKEALGDAQPASQVIVNASYGPERDYVLKSVSLTLEVFSDSYAIANSLSLWLEAKIRDIVGTEVKLVNVLLGPVRQSDPNHQEVRALDIELLVKGSTI